MKRLFCLILISFFLLSGTKEICALSLSAECACVIDMLTGRVIYEKNAHKIHTMASTTKIMTGLIALENSNPDDVVNVSKKAASQEGTSLYLKAGSKARMEDLIYGLLLQSGNDSAVAIAESISGTTEEFSKLMTDRAKQIGAQNTAFKNPNGLDEEGHFTTAYDLAIIAKEAMKNEKFREIVSTKSKTILDGTQTVSNHNKLLRIYDGCIGVKTGFTKKSGRCLVSAAERNGVSVIAVTLNAPNDWNDHKNMLDFAFSETEYFPVILKNMTVNIVTLKNGASKTIEVCADEDFYITGNKNEKFRNIRVTCDLPKELSAPVYYGDKVGELTVFYNDDEMKKINLISSATVLYEEDNNKILKNFKKFFTYYCEV